MELSQRTNHVGRRAWRGALMLGTGLVAVCAAWPVLAQQTPSVQMAQQRQIAFNIPPQSLTDALASFGRQSGMQVTIDGDAARGVASPGVVGTMTAQEALARLLAGTGIVFRMTGDNTAMLQRASAGQDPSAIQLDPVRVQAVPPTPPQGEIGNQSPAYAGGQVARGGKVGLLGNRDYMDTPFSETTYTEKYIQNQQAKTLTDVLAGDPTVRSGWPNGNVFDDRVVIRGIQVLNPNFGFGGIYGIVPGEADMTGIERVEVFRGPTAFLNGALPQAVGGTINLVPKRATDEPITQFTGFYQSDETFGGTIDVGRRFGPDNAIGLRANATFYGGGTAVDNQYAERLALTLGFDYRSEHTRIDADIGYLKRDVDAFQGGLFLASNVQLPAPPNANRSTFQPWETLKANDLYGALRFEHDITPGLTGFVKVGAKRANLQTIFVNQNIVNYGGDTTVMSSGQFLSATETLSAEGGVRAVFRTGPIKHEAAIVGDYLKTTNWSFTNPLAVNLRSNIYNPVYTQAPPIPANARTSAPIASDSLFTSLGIVDALSLLGDRIQVIGGARFQRLMTANYSATTGLPTSGNDQSVVSPSVAVVVKPTQEFMLYGNYIQALQQGPVAGAGLANAGQQFPPFVGEQLEIGAKVDFGNFGATLSAFQITLPQSFVNVATNTLVTDGQQRNRGLEFVAFGEPLAGLKLLGGFTVLDAKLTSTQGGVNNGHWAVGTSPFQFAVGADWDTPFVKGLGVLGRVVYNGQVYLNPANDQSAPPWTRFDAGLRYTFERPDGKPLTLRANVINLFDANYWVATNAFFVSNQPRTLMLSLTADF